MRQANQQAKATYQGVATYFPCAVMFAAGIDRAVAGPRSHVPFAILVTLAAAGGIVLSLLKNGRAAVWALQIALAAMVLDCAVTDFAGGHRIVGFVFLAFVVLMPVLLAWREARQRRRVAVS